MSATTTYHPSGDTGRSGDCTVAGPADRYGPVAPQGPPVLAPCAGRTPLQGLRLAVPRIRRRRRTRCSGTDRCATTPCCARPASGRFPSTRAAPSWRSASCSPTSAARPAWPSGSPPPAFAALLQDYYRSPAIAIDENGGIIDKFLGDGVMALFIPVIAGENHAASGDRGRNGRSSPGSTERPGRKGLMVGAGVHTGEAFVGVVGSDEKTDFTALGDTVNIAARLGGLAGPGELLVSRVAWDRAGLGAPPAGARGRDRWTNGRPRGGPTRSPRGHRGLSRATRRTSLDHRAAAVKRRGRGYRVGGKRIAQRGPWARWTRSSSVTSGASSASASATYQASCAVRLLRSSQTRPA